jgi:hypothetical protein
MSCTLLVAEHPMIKGSWRYWKVSPLPENVTLDEVATTEAKFGVCRRRKAK